MTRRQSTVREPLIVRRLREQVADLERRAKEDRATIQKIATQREFESWYGKACRAVLDALIGSIELNVDGARAKLNDIADEWQERKIAQLK